MPHKRAWPGNGRMPGIYCSGAFANGEECHRKLATLVGGLWVVSHEQYSAVVGEVKAIHCPECGTDNLVEPALPHAAVIEYGSTVATQTAS